MKGVVGELYSPEVFPIQETSNVILSCCHAPGTTGQQVIPHFLFGVSRVPGLAPWRAAPRSRS
jgi:hypothetical protein